MERGALVLSLVLSACPSTPAGPPQPRSPEPDPQAEPAEPSGASEPGQPGTRPQPAIAMVTEGPFKDLGFMRGDPRPDKPLLRATGLEPFGERGDALAERLIDRLDTIVACFESTPPSKRAWLSLRIGLGGDPDSLEVSLGPQDAIEPDLQPCIVEAVEPLRVTDGTAQGAFSFDYYPTAAEAPHLPEPQPGQKAAVRFGGACFVWIEEPPCPPRKRCYTDRWEPSLCPHRADQDGVYLRHELVKPKGPDKWTASSGLELTDPDGQPIWTTPWTAAERARVKRFDAGANPSPRYRGYLVELGPETIRLADRLGVRDYDRRSGQRTRTWTAPADAGAGMFVDAATFTAKGKASCTGETDHGSFASVCGSRLLYFDGYSFAVLDAQTLEPKAVTNLDAKTSSTSSDGADVVFKLVAGGVRLTVRGIIYLD